MRALLSLGVVLTAFLLFSPFGTTVVHAQVPDDICEQIDTLTYGQTATGTIDDDTVVHGYCFDGSEIRVRATVTGDLDAGMVLSDTQLENGYAQSEPGATAPEFTFTLPEDGTYIVFIFRIGLDEGDTEGDFELALELTNGEASGLSGLADVELCTDVPLIDFGETVRGTLTENRPGALYCIEVEEGALILTLRNTGDLVLSVIDPETGEALQAQESGIKRIVTIPRTGTFAVVAERAGDANAKFELIATQ
jgi:hypothetical protein